jgi:hypothetical protein
VPSPEQKFFDGWGPFAFGMTFDDAVTAHPAVVWTADSLRACRAELPVRGCVLEPAGGSAVRPTAGIALLPSLVINQAGTLAAIRLGQFLRGIERVQCERVHRRLSEHLVRTWGSPTASLPDPHDSSDGAVVGRQTFHAQADGRRITLRSSYIGATGSVPGLCHLGILFRGPNRLQPPPEEHPNPLKNWS